MKKGIKDFPKNIREGLISAMGDLREGRYSVTYKDNLTGLIVTIEASKIGEEKQDE
ncbi:MAG TPA: hypothetical protein PL092_03050 [Candidatus Pacearchaeota archaeon]|nr:hypothetical protein [Candidatus Pacearchaeota archaeon]